MRLQQSRCYDRQGYREDTAYYLRGSYCEGGTRHCCGKGFLSIMELHREGNSAVFSLSVESILVGLVERPLKGWEYQTCERLNRKNTNWLIH
jgi:hypothetical protein